MVDEWSCLLLGPYRKSFVAACTEAEADDGRLQAVLDSYFSTWKTSLMADDLSRLQMLARYAQIRDYVKVIHLGDEYNFETTLPFSVIWPRHEDGQVVAEAFGVELLKSMLAMQHLCPDRLKIRDNCSVGTRSNPETEAILARDILGGAELAVADFVLRKELSTTTFIAAKLPNEHQGQGTGLSILRKVEICLSHNLNSNSYWANQILLHAPALKELSLSFSQPRPMPNTPYFILYNATLPALEKLELSMADLSVPSIMAILSNSKQSLTGISFHLMTLGNNSTWVELLNRIHNEFPHLTWFKLSNLTEGIGRLRITFPGLDKDSVVGEPYKNGLKLIQRGPEGAKCIPGVGYGGPDANHVLRIVAEYAVAASIRP
ncbi:hypothetical protein DPV78_001401 [Talaromyces pinophilus]|nr:hypothetical protein DPV78_001401 [Talaromyces pinophilus]